MRPGGFGDQPQDGERGDALAAAGFADDAQRLAASQRIAHAVDRAHDAGRGEEMRLEILDLQQRTPVDARRARMPTRRRLHFTQDVTSNIPACYLWSKRTVQAIRARHHPQSAKTKWEANVMEAGKPRSRG